MRLLVVLACFAIVAEAFRAGTGTPVRMQFGAFKERFGKVYASHDEHEKRFAIFAGKLSNDIVWQQKINNLSIRRKPQLH